QRRELAFQQSDFFSERFVFDRQRLLARRQVVIVLPPVEPNLLRLVDGADEQTDPNREEFDLGQRHFDVARHDETLVEDTIENVNETGRAPVPFIQRHRHSVRYSTGTVPFNIARLPKNGGEGARSRLSNASASRLYRELDESPAHTAAKPNGARSWRTRILQKRQQI